MTTTTHRRAGPRSSPARRCSSCGPVAVDGLTGRPPRARATHNRRMPGFLPRCLAPDIWSYRMTDGMLNREPGEITIRMRSMLALMAHLARGVEAPGEPPIDEGIFVPLSVSATEERPVLTVPTG